MTSFFENDPDEILYKGTLYSDFYNLFPNLHLEKVRQFLSELDEMAVLNLTDSPDGWKIELRFHDRNFLLDTHYHGTSTLFCVADGEVNELLMLAFLGCFVPVIRDNGIRN